MGRQRAGSGWTGFHVGNKSIPVILAVVEGEDRWMTTGEARSWPRCHRCRTPVQRLSPGSLNCYGCAWKVATSEDKERLESLWEVERREGYNCVRAHLESIKPLNEIHRRKGENWRRILRGLDVDGR